VKKEKKKASSEEALVSFDRSWLPLSKIPVITPEKRTVEPGEAFEDTDLKPRFEIVK
jgi:hypothetical protein